MPPACPLILSESLLDCGQELHFGEGQLWFAITSEANAYFLGEPAPAAMRPRCAYVFIGPAEIRASKLAPATLHYFHLQQHDLTGLLTSSERQCIQQLLDAPAGLPVISSPVEPVSVAFQQLAEASRGKQDFRQRASVLLVIGDFLRSKAAALAPRATTGLEASATMAFEKLIETMPESDLLDATSEELAAKCGCSQRHFSRLYAARFKKSLKEQQMKLRLEKARGLMHDSEMRIIDAAMESGFKHLSLFNALFKRHYGATPSSFRQAITATQASRGKRFAPSRVAALLVLLGTTFMAQAAEPAPAEPVKKEQFFTITKYQVEGNTLLPESDLELILTDYTGTNVTAGTIQKALQSLVLAYRGKGYLTVGVGLPSAQINEGVLRLQVVEGRLADIKITGNKWYSTNNIHRALPSLRTNLVLNNRWFQPELDKANLNGDRQIYPMIEPGPEPGTSALNLKVKDRFPLHGRAEFNNRNSAGTPPFRADFAAQYNNLWQLEHAIGLQYNFTPDKYKSESRMPRFFDQPLVASYSGFYRIPLGSPRPLQEVYETNPGGFGYDEVTRQMRLPGLINNPDLIVFASRSDSDTRVSSDEKQLITKTPFVEVNQQNFSQTLSVTADVGSRFTQPLPEWNRVKSFFSVGVDYKHYRVQTLNTNINAVDLFALDRFGNSTLVTNVSVALPAHQISSASYIPLSAGLNFVLPDKLGNTSLGLNSSIFLEGLSDYGDDFRQIAGSPRAGGTFQIFTGNLTREQKIYQDWNALIRVNGQYTDRPLIGNEQFALGGSSGVRGYREGEEYGDTGWKIMVEPRTPLIDIGMVDGTMPMLVRFSVFVDYGERYLLEPGPREARIQQLGTGAAVQTSIGQRWDARLTLGFPLLETIYAKEPSARAYFAVGAQF